MTKIRLCICGAEDTEKASLTKALIRGEFIEGYVPTIEDEFCNHFKYGDQKYEIGIVDTTGQEDFPYDRKRTMKYSDVFCFVYAVDDENSLNYLNEIYEDCVTVKGSNPKILVCANDCDRNTKVTIEQAKEAAKKWGNPKIIEVSPMKRRGADEILTEVVRLYLGNGNQNNNSEDDGGCCLIQ